MSGSSIAPDPSDVPVCPVCQGGLRHIFTGARGGLFGCEISFFKCPTHGAVYRTREGMDQSDRHGDDDRGVPIGRPDKPPPMPNRAAAVPEPTNPDAPLSVHSDSRVQP